MPRLARSFFARDAGAVARDLLGMRLVRLLDDGARLSGIIVETEAYRPGDAASHAYRGKTERNAAMFMRPGTAYVYFTYGMHYCFNLVTGAPGIAAAVLIRALQPVQGLAVMRANRARAGKPMRDTDLCSGPARLCQALQIGRAFNTYDTCGRGSRLFVERGAAMPTEQVRASARIGIGGDAAAVAAEWRWFVAGSIYLSRRAPPPPRA